IEAARLGAAEDEQNLTDLQQQLYELDNRIKLGEAQNDYDQRESGSIEEREVEAHAEIERIDRKQEDTAADLDRVRNELGETGAATAGHADALREREETLRLHKESLAVVQKQIETARAEVGACKADIVRAESTERAAARRRDDLELRAGRVSEEDAR